MPFGIVETAFVPEPDGIVKWKAMKHLTGAIGRPLAIGLAARLAFGAESGFASQEASTAPPLVVDLGLADMVKRVLERNETTQEKLLALEASHHKHLAEQGIFEPEAFAAFSREVNNRQNNTEQAASADNIPVLQETNDTYSGGLEALVQTGARLRLGYTLTDMRNNIPITITNSILTSPLSVLQGNQWQTFFGLTVNQPLLKNFGPAATMAGIRVAALSSKIAFQEYRRQLMTAVSTAEATYWNLYLAQEQVRFFEESVRTAETVLKDNRTRFDAGKGSELEMLEAEAGLGLRRAKLGEAQQKVVEAMNRVHSLCAERIRESTPRLRAVDVPMLRADLRDYEKFSQSALELNPDYLIQQEKVDQELVRLGYARNQRLPELDLKGAYGLNGLGQTPGESWDAVSRENYASWSIGVEFRVPLEGGTKTRHELSAAELQVQSAEMALHGLQTEIFNGLDTTRHKALSLRESVASYESSVSYNQSLLDSALTRLEAGKLESRKVFEIESDLFEAKNSVVESLVRYQIALLEMEVVQGSLLEKRNLEVTQDGLREATQRLLRSGHLTGPEYLPGVNEQDRLSHEALNGQATTDEQLRNAERQKKRELEPE